MKKYIFSAICACVALFASAQEPVFYGYAPDQMAEAAQVAQGQGANGFLAGLVCFDPAVDPAWKRLEGHQVKGVRCYFRADYKQSRQDRSFIMHTVGTADATPTKKICDFFEGWNEIYFDEPLTIGSEPIFLGMQVYEQRGTSHPFVSYGSASVPGGCWINLNKQGWNNYTDRGTLLIQAILDDAAAEKIENMVYAQVATTPQTVAPSKTFDCEVYFHNHTGQTVNSVELQNLGQGDETPYTSEVFFDTPLAPHEGRNIPMEVYAGSETGVNQWVQLTVSKVNGEATQETRPGISHHYVTIDAFQRVPLVEEFTSQYCTNCPFMIYYLDKAMHEYDGELVYVTHHTGFAPDIFTHPGEDALTYLFGNQYSFNPAVMYDRRVFPGEIAPVNAAQVAETTPYTDAFNAVAPLLAMAEVNIDFTYNADNATIKPTISGRINSEMAAAGTQTYLSVYLVEDNIPVTEELFQQGLVEEEGAPDDLIESFRHNGVKRHVFTEHIGTALTLDGENKFSIEFEQIDLNTAWNADNMRMVAFVHLVDQNDMTKNEVLNAAQKWLTALGSVQGVQDKEGDVHFYINNDRTIAAPANVNSYRLYNTQGQFIATGSRLQPGVYIVNYKTTDGATGTQKLLVR